MNRDVPGNYPTGSLLQQPADNSYQSHLGQNWQLPSSNQHTSQYPASTPYFTPYSSDYAYPQQTASAWNSWPEQNNNTSSSYSSIPPQLNSQVHPSQWPTNSSSQLNCYSNEQQQNYYVNPTDYPVSQVHDPNGWQNIEQQTQGSQWNFQPQPPLETGGTDAAALNYAFDASVPLSNNKMEILTGQMQQCTLTEPSHLESNVTVPHKNLAEEPNQEVLPSFQQVESLPSSVISPSQIELIEGQTSTDPTAILPRRTSPFQPPVPSVIPSSLEQTASMKPEQLFPAEEPAVHQDATRSETVEESPSVPWTVTPVPEVKQESVSDTMMPPVSPSVVPSLQEGEEMQKQPENVEETCSSIGSRPHPLHLVLHRQHFSNDVDETCRTTLWENPIDSIPNFTLMPLAKQSQPNSREGSNEKDTDSAPNCPTVQKTEPEELPSEIPSSPPDKSVPEKIHEEPIVQEVSANTTKSSPLPTATNSPERKSREDGAYSDNPPRDPPRQRNSPPPVERRWTGGPEKTRQDQGRDERGYASRMPQEQNSFSDQSTDSRHFRPAGYYPPPPANYSSRPSSRASEPTGENYYQDHERPPSRMSEINDDRNGRDYDYSRSRSSGYRGSDYPRRRDNYERDYDPRSRNYDPRDSYDYRGRNSGRNSVDPLDQERTRASDFVDGDLDYDHQRQRYPDRYYSRSRPDNSYYMRPPANKGYDYYSSWPDPYAMFYAQYYHNYQTAAYGSRNNYGYHKELYETDPKYRQQVDNYQAYLNSQQTRLDYDSDQHSIQSGRSSVTEELRKDSEQFSRVEHSQEYSDSSICDSLNQPSPPPRITPVKFSCAHSIGHLSQGRIIAVLPNYSSYTCPVNIYDVQSSLHYDECLSDVKNYPGPLISGQTHKKDVMSYCQQKVQELHTREQVLDRTSQILLWELLILLVRQNGNVVGSDISELLLKDVRNVPGAQTPTSTHTTGTSPLTTLSDDLREGPANNNLLNNNPVDPSSLSSTPSPDEGIVVSQDRTLINRELSVQQVTQKFTEYLLYGNKKDALEWAVRHNLWGHALFLAYRMGSHSHANLMTRFANSLPLNDPLQTLYQLMSGRQPISVTSVADEKWGDWRPHLAMILSNPTSNSQVDLRSIITLGDTLAQKGCLFAAHFCYLMAQVEFGTFDNKSSKYVLLGANHRLPFETFATNESIHLTEIYEYAMSLGKPNYMLANFQPYKFLYATRLAECGLLKESLQYCEVMSTALLQFPSFVSLSLFKQLHALGNRLKYNDPHYTHNVGELEELGDPPWLAQLNHDMILHLKQGGMSARGSFGAVNDQGNFVSDTSHLEGYTGSEYQQQATQRRSISEEAPASSNLVEQIPMEPWNNYSYSTNYSYNQGPTELVQEPESTLQGHPPVVQSEPGHQEALNSSSLSYYDQIPTLTPTFPVQGSQNLYSTTRSRERQDSVDSNSSLKSGFSARTSNTATGSREEGNAATNSQQSNKANQQSKQDSTKKQDAARTQTGRSWFGNIMNKFLPKGPNQMILPDDKAPRIVWDEKMNMWVDLDGNSDDVANANLPPPKDSELASLPVTGEKIGAPSFAPPTDQNRFQRPKHRGMRQNYVDILNSNVSSSGGNQSTMNAAPDSLFPRMDTNTGMPSSFFVPSTENISDSTSNLSKPDASDYLSTDRRSSVQEAEVNQSPLLNPADFNINAVQDLGGNRKPNVGRLTGRRAYPS